MRIRAYLLFIALCALPIWAQNPSMETITIDANAPARPFPHYWEQMFGSGRAILSLRDSYRRDLKAVRQITDFQYIRFHGILLDDVGVYDESPSGSRSTTSPTSIRSTTGCSPRRPAVCRTELHAVQLASHDVGSVSGTTLWSAAKGLRDAGTR